MNTELALPIARQRRVTITPRFIRAIDAPAYLGMCRDEFNKTVRPNVHEFPIGQRGVAFDRLELDAWADEYIQRSAIEKRAASANNQSRSERQGEPSWREKPSRASRKGTGSGTSTKGSTENDFMKALALVTGRKQKST